MEHVRGQPPAHAVSLAVVLYIFWLFLSGHDEPILLMLSAVSCAGLLIIAHRMEVVDHGSHLTPRLPLFRLRLLTIAALKNTDYRNLVRA